MKAEVIEWASSEKDAQPHWSRYKAVKVTNDNAEVIWYNYKTYIEMFGEPRQPGALP
uniref:Uncharacterized protein n=1 Tax=viral metagenome TaxID=1070528 RepID=A0A6M3K5S1_9ZZZZ